MLTTILISILIIIIGILGYGTYNLIKKNEYYEDFVEKQSEAIGACDKRLKEVDEKGIFHADDEIGWFFQEIKNIQEAINEFRLKS
jgi:hypothetical protein